ncbi:MAG: hypothetical protein WAN18_23285 [Candidatus Sulfotelmatobacter sp.]
MSDWITPTASLDLRKILPLVCLFCALLLVAQNKQPPSPPKYDLQAEMKLKGTIEEVKLPPKGSEKEIAYLLVKSGTNTVDVYLCPQSFLAEMGVSFNKGDEISLTGSKVKQGEAELVLAREVVRGNDTVVLRDDKGNPVWSWRR